MFYIVYGNFQIYIIFLIFEIDLPMITDLICENMAKKTIPCPIVFLK